VKPEDLTALNLQIHAAQGAHGTVVLYESIGLDGKIRHSSSYPTILLQIKRRVARLGVKSNF
jgi:hypothetical protein